MSKKLVSFAATKKVSKPVKIKFQTKSGERVSFTATKKIPKPIKVKFFVKKKNG